LMSVGRLISICILHFRGAFCLEDKPAGRSQAPAQQLPQAPTIPYNSQNAL